MGSVEEAVPLEFPQIKENTIRVYKHRAHHDYQTVYNILASSFDSNISFVVIDEDGEPGPISLPITAVAGRYEASNPLPEDDGDEEQYVRDQESFGDGSFDCLPSRQLSDAPTQNDKVTTFRRFVVSSTKVDGIVLHFAPNGHSLNYQSCVIHGDAEAVMYPDEKSDVAPQSMKNVQVIRVVIRSASAKIRVTNINGLEKAELIERDDMWTGVFPLYEVLDDPVASG